MSTRCMTPAVYFSSGSLSQSEFHHYGLATPIYTHFTSPIRRYAGTQKRNEQQQPTWRATLRRIFFVFFFKFWLSVDANMLFLDVIVHRLLAASIGAAPLPVQINHRNVQRTCNNINRRHRMADIAGTFFLVLFFEAPILTGCRTRLYASSYSRIFQEQSACRGRTSHLCQAKRSSCHRSPFWYRRQSLFVRRT